MEGQGHASICSIGVPHAAPSSHRRVRPVDDWGQGEDRTIGVVEHRVDNRVLDDWDKLLELQVMLEIVLRKRRRGLMRSIHFDGVNTWCEQMATCG